MAVLRVKAERWNRIQEVFDAATERPRNTRRDFVTEECADDHELRKDVLAMLDADESAGEFIETAVRGATTSFAAAEDPTRKFTKFGKYEILGFIGEGGFSQVHLGRDPDLQRDVAIKTCTSASRDLRKRFYREAKISAGLQHPNIVTVHDLGVENGIPFLVQEFLSGNDLATLLARTRRMSPSTAVDQLIQVARGLEYAHRKGVLHRDIKPSNVQALTNGRVKILDFGIARFLEEDNPLTDRGAPIGTAGYQSPEQLEGAELDRRTDIFSFGVLAYELLAAKRPFPGRTFAEVYHKVLESRPVPLRQINRQCPAALETLVARCLENDREKRPENFTLVIRELERIGAGLSPPTNPGADLGTVTVSRPPRRAVTAGAALVLLATLGWFLSRAFIQEPTQASDPQAQLDAPPPADGTFRGSTDGRTPVLETLDTSALDSRPVAGTERHGESPESVGPGLALDEGISEATDKTSEQNTTRPAFESTIGTAETTDPGGPAVSAAQVAAPGAVASRTEPAPLEQNSIAGAVPNPAVGEEQLQVDRSVWEETAPPVSASDPTGAALGTNQEGAIDDLASSGELGDSPLGDPARGPRVAGAGESSPPELLEPLALKYPTRVTPKERVLLQREESVLITLQVLVDETGQVRQASVRNTNEPGTAYQDAALASVRQAQFRPGTRDGESIQMWTLLSLEYPLR